MSIFKGTGHLPAVFRCVLLYREYLHCKQRRFEPTTFRFDFAESCYVTRAPFHLATDAQHKIANSHFKKLLPCVFFIHSIIIAPFGWGMTNLFSRWGAQQCIYSPPFAISFTITFLTNPAAYKRLFDNNNDH